MHRQKGFAPVLIVVLIALALGVFLVYQKQTKLATPSQATQVISSPGTNPESSSSAETASWKTYSSQSLGISFKYPVDKNFKEYPGNDGKSIMIGPPDSNYALNITVFDNSQKMDVKDWIEVNLSSLYSALEINGKKITFQDLKLTNKQLVGQSAIEVDFGGQSPEIFLPHPNNLKIYKLSTTFDQNLLNQILSTFKFQ